MTPRTEMELRIAKWGNGLALRLPADLVRRLGLKDGDSVQAQLAVDGSLSIRAVRWHRHALANELAQARAMLPIGEPLVVELRRDARY